MTLQTAIAMLREAERNNAPKAVILRCIERIYRAAQ
jgi:hypothetical protein